MVNTDDDKLKQKSICFLFETDDGDYDDEYVELNLDARRTCGLILFEMMVIVCSLLILYFAYDYASRFFT